MLNLTVSIEAIALSNYTPLWIYVLSEIGKACVEEENVKALTTCRNLLNVRLTNCMPPLPGEASEQNASSYPYHLAVVWNNYQVLLFSISGIQSLYVFRRGTISFNTLPASIRANLENFDISKLNVKIRNYTLLFFFHLIIFFFQ